MHKLTENSRAINDLVIIQNVKQDENRYKRYGLEFLDEVIENFKAVKGKILSVGKLAEKENINKGDIVLYDKHSVFAEVGKRGKGTEKEGEIVITKVDNVIGVVE